MTEAEAMHLLEKVVHEHEQAYPSTVEALGRIRRALKDSHRERWLETYNAVLLSVGVSDTNEDTQECLESAHNMATRQADLAHGKLTP